jgi:hypothetical protein
MRGLRFRIAGAAFAPLLLFLATATGCGGDDDDAADDDATGDDATGDDATGDDAADDSGDDSGDDDTGAAPPTYPRNHEAWWFCYTCHEADFNGSPGEPHGHVYAAPDQCVTCHQKGDWINEPHGPVDPFPIMDCLKCHPGQHGKGTWQDKMECVVCHQPAN